MPRLHLLRIGLLMSLLALAGQLAFGATVPERGLTGVAVICHAGAGHEKPVPPRRHEHRCMFCPLCATLAAPAPPLVSPPVLPKLPAFVAEPAVISLPRIARLATIPAAAQPRGPPSLA